MMKKKIKDIKIDVVNFDDMYKELTEVIKMYKKTYEWLKKNRPDSPMVDEYHHTYTLYSQIRDRLTASEKWEIPKELPPIRTDLAGLGLLGD